MSQEKWPAVGRYIWELNPKEDCDLLDMPVNGESGECFIYQRNCRVYGDEMPLDRIRLAIGKTNRFFGLIGILK